MKFIGKGTVAKNCPLFSWEWGQFQELPLFFMGKLYLVWDNFVWYNRSCIKINVSCAHSVKYYFLYYAAHEKGNR